VITPPSVVHGRVISTLTVVMNVRGVVEKLASEGASPQAIGEAIRQESPEIADMVQATNVPHGWTLHQWVVVILMLISVALQAYDQAHPETPPPSIQEIAKIVEDELSRMLPAAPVSGEGEHEHHESK